MADKRFKSKRVCAEPGCDHVAVSKGFCGKCYRLNRRRDPALKALDAERHKKFETKEYARKSLLRKYGLDADSYQALEDSQNGNCAICKLPPSGRGVAAVLHIDHCHKTSKVRGLLCSTCNVAIGNLKHSPRIIDSAITYMNKHAPAK